MEPLVRFEQRGGVGVLTLSRADKRNALNLALWGELEAHLATIEALGEALGAVVLRAAGPVFCAGNDLKERGIAAPRANYQASIVTRLASLPQPVIVAVQGGCFTGGLELALACDILIGSENARFADTHARVGIMPGWGLSQKLARMIGISRAKELSLSGNFLDARTACEWGLLNRVVPADELLGAAKQLAADIATADPGMVQAYKALIDEGYALSFGEGMALENARSTAANSQVDKEEVEARRLAVMERGREQKG